MPCDRKKSVFKSLNDKQVKHLMGYMKSHTEFAKGHITNIGVQGKATASSMWQNLTEELNSYLSESEEKDVKFYQNVCFFLNFYYLIILNILGYFFSNGKMLG